jgi:phosphoribosyl-ATP pyrophosphohydrolase
VGSMLGDYAVLAQQYDNQWLFLDHTLLDNLEAVALKQNESQSGSASSATLTADDIDKIAKTVGEVNKEYLFTTDTQKAVFTVIKEVGKENKDGRNMYHYEVGLHKQHTKDYLNAMADSLQDTPITKLTNGQKVRDAINIERLLKSVDQYKESDTAHVFVDLKTKLIGVVRIEAGDKKQNYVEIGQNYQGGDVMPFKLTWYDDTSTSASMLAMSLNVNKKTSNAEGNLTLESSSGESSSEKSKLSMKFTTTPNSKALDLQKPEGAKSIYELLGPMMTQALTSGIEDLSSDESSQDDGAEI